MMASSPKFLASQRPCICDMRQLRFAKVFIFPLPKASIPTTLLPLEIQWETVSRDRCSGDYAQIA
ncbi:hypothetical protein B0F90DRAFT_171787 [Multifurca ochricompacta]|uniref:Uncharacterized protein n=1 Tax=Multifurca ochricompacta TaxID=376703 RepID=A0AAD4M7Q5_9AGAM|nr:hypothetical protein B0F90DRAFT_171787 [Multifurca ochricompacta]